MADAGDLGLRVTGDLTERHPDILVGGYADRDGPTVGIAER